MGLVGSQQSRRRTMLDALFEQDEIFCLAVELIDLELVCKDGQIPFQKIDEDLLTRPEHRPQRAVLVNFDPFPDLLWHDSPSRSEEHTSELQSLMRISYAVFSFKKKNSEITTHITQTTDKIVQRCLRFKQI